MADRGRQVVAAGRDGSIELRDGRRLSYTEVGDPGGFPVLSCHGGLSSRLDVVPAQDTGRELGARIISPDRPGIGTSDRRAGRALIDWPDDAAQLLDQLGVSRFSVLGWSLGGLYALAVARFLPDRVSTVAVVASPIPVDWDGMRDGINRMDRTFMKLSERHARVERTIFHLMHAEAAHLPRAFARSAGVSGELAESLPRAVSEGLHDPAGVVDDYRVMSAPWGFEPSEITTAVHIWHGDADTLVPPAWSQQLHETIPNSELTVVHDAGHYLAYDHWPEILAALLSVR